MPNSIRRRYLLATLALASLPLTACDGEPAAPSLGRDVTAENPFVVSGTVHDLSAAPLPPEARVVVAWQVMSGSPDYLYVFGEGSIAPSGSSFEVRLPSAPPAAALNSFGLGVGVVLLTTDPAVRTGTRLERLPAGTTVGAAARYAVLYADRDPARIGSWVTRFPRGFSVGKGVAGAGPFESFEPVDAGSVQLIVDSLGDLGFVNWS
jgi:hypothetical protein